MSLPAQLHATLQRCATDAESVVHVASVEEMPGIQATAPDAQGALDELASIVGSIQRRSGGEPCEIIPPPFIGYACLIPMPAPTEGEE